MDKVIDVSDRYSAEISSINSKLNQLEKGRIYELTGAKKTSMPVTTDLSYFSWSFNGYSN